MPYKDPEKNKAYQREWKRKQREWFWELKATLACEECGISHPAVIQFHHPNDEEKLGNVGKMVNSTYSQKQILAEIEKCRILCANCHFILHYEEGYDYTKIV